MRSYGLFIDGSWVDGGERIEVASPYDGTVVSNIARGGLHELEAAVQAAERSVPTIAGMSPAERAEILERTLALVRERREKLALAVSEEAGKPISQARVEADRCADTIAESADLARHPEVEAADLAGRVSGSGRLALIRRVPVGPVLGITPFNFPLNLVAHKLAPAVTAGCPVVLKPASQTPSPALMLAEILNEAGLPAGALNVVPCRGGDAEPLVEDERFGLITFTGSMDVGWRLKRLGWRRRVALELGGNAAVMVEPDVDDLEAVAGRIAATAFGYAGQSCISVQRVLIRRELYDPMRDALVTAAEAVPAGNPAHESTVCGPLIDRPNADRVADWIASATAAGGRVLTGGQRSDSVITPTLLENVPTSEPVVADEVFGPVAVLFPYDDLEDGLAMVNDSRYGLQAGIFTSDTAAAQRAWETLEVGAIIHNDVPSWRTDPMPYGGVKASGVGREGPRYAYREMTEERMLVLRR